MHRNTARIMAAGRPVSWLGANFWSRAGGPFMWRAYDPATVRAELRVLREHGLTMTRSFFFWPDFMPGPEVIDEEMAARFADFLDRHTEQNMVTVPTFIVGHMSGQNWDPPWRVGRDLLSDVWLVGRQAWFAGEMTRRFGRHLAVAGWLVSNEMPLYGGDRAPHETVAAWAQIIRAPTAAALERLAADGACVYLSYSAGDTDRHRGPWYGRLDETFGVRHQLDVGLASPIGEEVAVLRLQQDFGGLAAGTTLSFAVAGNRHSRAFLPVEPAGAEVIATDARGRPALLLRRAGPGDRGSLILGTYPVEHMAALTPRVNPDDTVTLYRALATHAGVRRPVTVSDPRVACDSLVRDDGTSFAVLASHAAEPLTVQPVLAAGQIPERVTMAPFGINVLEVTAAGATDLSGPDSPR